MLVAAVAIAIVHVRSDRARVDRSLPGISFYLDDEAVMDLYLEYSGKYGTALSKDVKHRITTSREFEGSTTSALLKAQGKQGVTSEILTSYLVEAEPITVIRTVIDVLNQASDIVDVDLLKQEVTANHALDNALGTEGKRPTRVCLRRLKTFVSISGEFRETYDSTAEEITFEAPYGDSDAPTYVRLRCTTSGLRRTRVPRGTFSAYCLGRVEGWDDVTGRLDVFPIAIFN